VILACQSSCRSQGAFVDHLAGVVGKRKRRILAVDDEKQFLELLELNFSRAGQYELRTEDDPLAAIAAVDEFQPDLCIVDLKMPGMDGAQLITRIREESHIKNVPMIILTALLTDTAVEAVTKDNVLHLSKPASWKKLFYCVEAHLESSNDPASGLATIDV
jgi:DNA-binding response OmpR family regulator